MQHQSDSNSHPFSAPNCADIGANECNLEVGDSKMQEIDSILEDAERLCNKRIDLHLDVVQVWHMIQARNYDISENTVRRFFEKKGVPQRHTIDVISAVLNGTVRDDFDPSQARAYYTECIEARISLSDIQQEKAELEKQCESLAARLKAYEEAIGFYRRQLDLSAQERQKLIDMIK